MQVDPDNRLVADSLEGEWNGKLRVLVAAKEEYDRLCQKDRAVLDDGQRANILALATNFPQLWQDPNTPDRERKRMVRLLLEDVTLVKRDQILVQVRFKGGVVHSLTLPLPLGAPELRKTDPAVIREVDRLFNDHTETEIAVMLNEKDLHSGSGQPFTPMSVTNIRRHHGLRDRFQRLRDTGLLTLDEMAERLDIAPCVVRAWRDKGLLRAHRYNDKDQCLYEPPPDDLPGKFKKKRPYLLAKEDSRHICQRSAV